MERRFERSRHRRWLECFSPPAMVAAATRRREAGDWRGACAEAFVTVEVDLRVTARRYGTEAADAIRTDLAGFAPDLLRRFLPRGIVPALAPALRPGVVAVLARAPGVPFLKVATPGRPDAPQRLWLGVGDPDERQRRWVDVPAWCWDAAARSERRWAYGASEARLPWHTADGRPYRPGETTPPDAPRDRAAQVEAEGGVPPDAELLRWGDLTREQLHPLVQEAFFGSWSAPPRPHPTWPDVHVRCGDEWHRLRIAGGTIAVGRHAGVAWGCDAAVRAWEGGGSPIPKSMRKLRQEVFTRLFHGDGHTVAEMIAAGLPADVRDTDGATIAHYLAYVDHRSLLPALLAAGAPMELPDRATGRTPLALAARLGADDVVAALTSAGVRR